MSEINGDCAHSVVKSRALLLSWYDSNKRTLPWRDVGDPWATWVSEIMLQQTRVSSVLEYFDRFITRFPNPQTLAEAEWDEVASLWAGLGYYSRAKNLWNGAKQVVEKHNAQIPSDPKSVRALSGIGPYTAGAILSIAFGQEAAIVDGNVIRVFSRLYQIEEDIKLKDTQKRLWALAEAWVKGERPGDLNQALMELGATVCTPKVPMCLLCPMQENCQAYRTSDPLKYPVKSKKKKKRPIETYLALILKRKSHQLDKNTEQYAVFQRDNVGLLGGLWTLPMINYSPLESPQFNDYLSFFAKEVEPDQGVTLTSKTKVKHAFTHKEWHLWPILYDLSGQSTQCIQELESHLSLSFGDIQWHSVNELDQLALGGPSLKALIHMGITLRARRGAGR